ncbi:DUF3103 family protein [Aquimarina sediminis]|uniref:DUF3103 family protein n=1 Tax=Aquimarina sediminis TaxID=2070536 RepID=UPI0013E8C3FF|nr:DUF3103 family protein [Aquimarina sediminis]
MKKSILLLNVLIISLFFFSCETEEVIINEANNVENENSISKKKITFDLIDLLGNTEFNTNVINTLSNNHTPGIKLSELLEKNTFISDKKAYSSLKNIVDQADERLKSKELPDQIEIPELWLQKPNSKSINYDNLLISYAPEGDEESWTNIEAYTLDKQKVYLDIKEIPNVPVLVIETKGYETLKAEVDYMNKQLQSAGLQNNRFSPNKMDLSPSSKSNNGLETTKLDKIKLNNDEEPWISGAAEIYAITSGIKNANNEAEVKIIPMYYLDYDGTTYYPNQIMLFWDDYKYQAANIQLFEKDDNYNYKQLVTIIVDGIFQIVGTVYGQPWVNVLGQVAGAILQAMPDEWYTNNDDYVDSLYTIQKNKTYTNHVGARGNATVSLSPLFISSN